jgi:(2Fe-2S) ferredoxin
MFTLRKVECLGSCTTAPVCQINDDYYENLTPEKIKEIVADLKADRTPRHISNGPTLEGGKCGYAPMVGECQK